MLTLRVFLQGLKEKGVGTQQTSAGDTEPRPQRHFVVTIPKLLSPCVNALRRGTKPGQRKLRPVCRICK